MDSLFERVVVGVDGSSASIEACRRAASLVAPGGRLELVTVYDTAPAVHTGWNAPRVRVELEDAAHTVLAAGLAAAGGDCESLAVDGDVAKVLLREVTRLDATLVAVGASRRSRRSQLLFGSIERELLRRAPCSVLVVR